MPPAVFSPRTRAERTLAAARVALAISSLFAIWIDPAEPARHAQVTYTLHWIYVSYSLGLAIFTWTLWTGGTRLPFATHTFDIIAFSIFQYLTLGPSSPFFVYFIFSLFCGAVRWGWRGTLSTGLVVVAAFVAMGISMNRTLGPSEFELNRFIIRMIYLGVTAAMLVYLGRYEERLRGEIDRLARWPSAVGLDPEQTMREIMEHAARILRASRVAVLWESGEEPWVHLAVWDAAHGASVKRMAPDEMSDPLPDFESSLVVSVHFETENVSGRLFLMPAGSPPEELAPLADVVAREIGASLDQLSVTQRLREIAASEERIRLARDLHDGVLQSLTGIRLELRAIASTLNGTGDEIRGRLFALERALAIEQRELRFFIGDLKPPAPPRHDGSLVSRLDALRERIALEWKAPVSITVTPASLAIPDAVEQAVPMMVHEAVVNALKHAQPSRVAVNVATADGELHIVVTDDGRGFPFKGRYDHAALSRSPIGPRSLFDRVSAFGGRMAIDSSDTGSRIEMVLSL
jgi:signal transduction histidine kinase